MNPALSLPNVLLAQAPNHDAGRRRVIMLTAASAELGADAGTA